MNKRSITSSSDWYDFSKDSTIKDSLLTAIKRDHFRTWNKAAPLADDELEWVNAAEKPRDTPKKKLPGELDKQD